MSDTPLVNAALVVSRIQEEHLAPESKKFINFARQLERELAEQKVAAMLARQGWDGAERELAEANLRIDELGAANVRLNEAHRAELGATNAVLEEALKDIADGPGDLESYHYGIRCGLEDRDLQNGSQYVAAEYGYDQGLDWCADIARRALKSTGPHSVP